MKLNKLVQFGTVAITTIVGICWLNGVQAGTFEETEIDQTKVTAIARPFGSNQHDLLIIEQISDKQDCWDELNVSSNKTVVIEPLLLNFDFTGICQRSTDSNGYSIRINGQDLGLDYMLNVVERDGELVLIGVHRIDRSQPEILIGSTNGMSQGFLKINLYPGWRFTRRTYEGKVLGHIYLSKTDDATVSQIPGGTVNPDVSTPTAPTSPTLPTQPTAPGQTIITPETSDPTQPTNPGLPEDNLQPNLPEMPTDNLEPNLPTDPTLDPVAPGVPTTPTEPTTP